MANYLVGPWEVDEALATGGGVPVVLRDAAALSYHVSYGAPLGDVAAAHNWVAGCATSGGAYNMTKSLANFVLRFASPSDASAVAAEMAAQSSHLLQMLGGGAWIQTRPTSIPRHSDTLAVTHGFEDGTSRVWAYTTRGPYVLCQVASSTDGTDSGTDLVARMLDRQGPLIDTFTPTPIDQLACLPIDPSGLAARILGDPRPPVVDVGPVAYEPRAWLHFERNPLRAHALFTAAGLQMAGYGFTHVYQTRDAGSARMIVDAFAAELTEDGYVPAVGIAGMPEAKCLVWRDADLDETSVFCLAVADRYAFTVTHDNETKAHQMAVAQYLMLTSD